MWFQVNRNKFSVTLDLAEEKDREILRDLVGISDVLLENSRGGVMSKLGCRYEDLVKLRNDLIMVSMPAFGATGPYASFAGYGATIESVGGIQNLTGYHAGGKPHRVREMDVTSGVMGACAVMTGLMHRNRTGEGQYIDVSQLEAVTHGTIGEHLLAHAMHGNMNDPLGNRHRRFAPQGCYRCREEDNWLTLSIRSEEEWHSLCRVLGHPEWAADPRFSCNDARRRNHDEIDRLIEAWTIGRPHRDAFLTLQAAGIPAGAVLSVSEVGDDPHLAARGYFLNAEDGTEKRFMGMPFRFSRDPGRVRWRGPDLGRHNRLVVCDLLGRPPEDIPPVTETDIGTAFDPE